LNLLLGVVLLSSKIVMALEEVLALKKLCATLASSIAVSNCSCSFSNKAAAATFVSSSTESQHINMYVLLAGFGNQKLLFIICQFQHRLQLLATELHPRSCDTSWDLGGAPTSLICDFWNGEVNVFYFIHFIGIIPRTVDIGSHLKLV
jgi:hypothetical protein